MSHHPTPGNTVQRFPPLLLLALLCGALFLCWILPVLLLGWPEQCSPLLSARNFQSTGLFSQADAIGRILAPHALLTEGIPSAMDGRLSTIIAALLLHFLSPQQLVAWSVVSAILSALVLVPFWLFIVRVFNRQVAWIATAVFGCFPLWVIQAQIFSSYQLSLLFLFASFAIFVWTAPRAPTIAFILSGLLFGASIAAKDVFLIFLPWMIFGSLWIEHRRGWRRTLGSIAIFLCCTAVVYLLPYAGDITRYGYPLNQNLARLWPGAAAVSEQTYLHLYPDPYTFTFERATFDTTFLREFAQRSWLERMINLKLIMNYHLAPVPWFMNVLNGCWLMLLSIPPFFQQNTMGGIALWIILLPGAFVLAKNHRRHAILLGGLVLTSYSIVRFVLHYDRDHLMNVLWVLAILAGVGIQWMGSVFAKSSCRLSAPRLATLLTLLLCFHLLQTSRVELGRLSLRSEVPHTLALAESLAALDVNAVIALPLHPTLMEDVATLSSRTVVLFTPQTIERLLRENTFADVFHRYGVTHISGYDSPLSVAMRQDFPTLQEIADPAPSSLHPTPLGSLLLNVFH